MEKSQAITIIKQLHSQYKGTLQEHQVIQEAIKTIEQSFNKENKDHNLKDTKTQPKL